MYLPGLARDSARGPSIGPYLVSNRHKSHQRQQISLSEPFFFVPVETKRRRSGMKERNIKRMRFFYESSPKYDDNNECLRTQENNKNKTREVMILNTGLGRGFN